MAAAAPKPQTDYFASSAATVPVSPAVSPRVHSSAQRAPRVRRAPEPIIIEREEQFDAQEIRTEVATRRVRSRARSHRPLRLTWTAVLCAAALMGQLVLLLWMHGRALSSARQVDELDAKIAVTANQIERIQERIAAYDSAPRIAQWARELGWRPAGHLDFDDVTKTDVSAAITAQTAASASTSNGTNSPTANETPTTDGVKQSDE